MRWWTKGLILSVVWLAVVVAAGYIHTEVFLAGQTTQAQDEAISEMYGMAAGFGLAVVWVICFFGLRGTPVASSPD
jgi:tryptophan-rich sensory protein